MKVAQQAPCCLRNHDLDKYANPPAMSWDPPNNENAKANVDKVGGLLHLQFSLFQNNDSFHMQKQMVIHLQKILCPKGVKVWPVQSTSWLDASITCGDSGKFCVSNSKTDFILLTECAWESLDAHIRSGRQVSSQQLTEVLQCVVAFYEAKTSKALLSDSNKAQRQAILEFLAGDNMRNCEDHLVVLMGDGNVHYCKILACVGP